MYDPPRAEGKDAVAKCLAAGIRVVMITGDHLETATAIARELGIATADHGALASPELEAMTDEELRKRVPTTAVYARVSAEHKLRIISAWKANDAVVAMTGDGVNDAPAIKGADIGIAMGRSGRDETPSAPPVRTHYRPQVRLHDALYGIPYGGCRVRGVLHRLEVGDS